MDTGDRLVMSLGDVEVYEDRHIPGNYWIFASRTKRGDALAFYSFRRQQLLGWHEAKITDEGIIRDRNFAVGTALKLAGSPSGKFH
jgi:hypothetical protein